MHVHVPVTLLAVDYFIIVVFEVNIVIAAVVFQIFCSECSSYLVPLPYKNNKMCRVCQTCYGQLTSDGERETGFNHTDSILPYWRSLIGAHCLILLQLSILYLSVFY